MSDSAVLTEALAALEQLHPKRIDLSLDRMWRLLDALDHPERNLPPVLHIAGTNGKGSVSALLRAALEAAGYRVHVYTNPHLVRFNERVRLAGRLISDDELVKVLNVVEAAADGRSVTFFEATTAAAFLAFVSTPADVLILETGLGGRLDATNVVSAPALSILTSIDLDHQAYLGETLADIAAEKAGIMKSRVPVVSAPQASVVADVLRAHAERMKAPLFLGGVNWTWQSNGEGFQVDQGALLPHPALAGPFQVTNAAVAMKALDVWEGYGGLVVPYQARVAAMKSVTWPARLQHLQSGRLVEMLSPGWSLWLDGGHNPHAAQALAPVLKDWSTEGSVDLICGMIETKDAETYLKTLSPFVRSLTCVPIEGGLTGRGLSAEALADVACAAGYTAPRTAPDIDVALTTLDPPSGLGRVLIAGSLYLAGCVLEENGTLLS